MDPARVQRTRTWRDSEVSERRESNGNGDGRGQTHVRVRDVDIHNAIRRSGDERSLDIRVLRKTPGAGGSSRGGQLGVEGRGDRRLPVRRVFGARVAWLQAERAEDGTAWPRTSSRTSGAEEGTRLEEEVARADDDGPADELPVPAGRPAADAETGGGDPSSSDPYAARTEVMGRRGVRASRGGEARARRRQALLGLLPSLSKSSRAERIC